MVDRPSIMSDAEYQRLRAEALEIVARARAFDAWRFKHEARTRGEKHLGLWVWAMHLEAMDAP